VSGRATLYVKAGCAFCEAKRRALEARGLAVTVVDVAAHPEAVPELLKLTKGRRRVPVVVEAGRISIAPDGGADF